MDRATLFTSLIAMAFASAAWAADPAPLVLEAKIPLGNVRGRIDHLAIDLDRQRLFIAELGNNSVGVVDLRSQQVIHRIDGLREPQGVGYAASTDTLYVANAGDGSVRLFQGGDFASTGGIALGDDADNIRIDTWRNRVVVGYGRGALAIIDARSRRKIADIPLGAHPEGFQFDGTGERIFANVPDGRHIALIDVAAAMQTSTISVDGARSNFPMAVDRDGRRMLAVFRSPPKVTVLASQDGKSLTSIDTCGDADDVFVDAKRRRVYVSCGQGAIDVLEQRNGEYQRSARIPTSIGARTSLFVPETDRLYLAVRSSSREPAAIWVFRPAP